jgi:hypothetical protein
VPNCSRIGDDCIFLKVEIFSHHNTLPASTMSCTITLLEKAAAGISARRARVTKRKADAARDADDLATIESRIEKRYVEIDLLKKKIAELSKLQTADYKVTDSIDRRKRQRETDEAQDLAIATRLAANCNATALEMRTVGIMDYGRVVHEFTEAK